MLFDVQVRDGAPKNSTEDQPASPPVNLRQSQPVMVLLPRTNNWFRSLPEQVRPHALAAQFARIANLICAVWDDPPACRKYLEELLVDRRGKRKGFPMAVLRELSTLRAYYVGMHDAFDRSRKRT